MESLFGLFFCAVVPVVALIGLLIFFGRRGSGPRTVNPYVTPKQPAAPSSPVTSFADLTLDQFAAFDRLLSHWARQGSLSAATASEVRARLAEHVVASFGVAPDAAFAAPTMSVPVRQAPATQVLATQPPLQPASLVQPAIAAQAARPLQAAPVAPAAGGPATPVERPPVAPKPHRPSPIAALGAALLALDTRRVLLFLGTFLLVMSSLTLVIFNWSSFSPLVQFALLAGTTAAIWAGGTWMTRKPDLATAGTNLQLVAALLMPVVGFALGRPGLLDLEPRSAWLLASVLSLGAYLLAAWRTGRGAYSGAAAIAAVSALLAALGDLDLGWQPVPVLLLLAVFLPIARALRAGPAPRLAAGPRWVALVGGPTVGLAVLAFFFAGMASTYASAASLAAAAVFCALAAWTEQRRPWLWAAVLLAPAAAQLALLGAEATLELRALTLGGFALAYVALADVCATRLRPAAWPLLGVGLALGGLAGAIATTMAPMALPPPILLAALVFVLVERGRLSWVGVQRVNFAALALGLAPLLLAVWLDNLLARVDFGPGMRGLLLLPLAVAAFAGAYWWPGRRERRYDVALQIPASALTLFLGLITQSDQVTRLPGAILIALILGWQATLRRGWPWATLSIGAALAAVVITLDRIEALWLDLPLMTLVTLACAVFLSLAGERLRRTALRYWSWPALGWGVVAGMATFGLAALQLNPVHPVAAGSIVSLGLLLGAHSALWRRAEPGYGAAPLLALGLMLAATEGFFTGWQLAAGDLAYVLCALVFGLALLGRFVGRFGTPYGRPYELLAFVLLPAAPLLAGVDPVHLTLTWAAMAALYGLALWRYRLPPLLAPAFLSLDMALLHGAAWLWPGGDPAGAGLLVAGAVVAQTLASAWTRRRSAPWDAAGQWGYLSALVGGCGALLLTTGSAGYSAAVALVLAALLAVLVWLEGREELAWGSLALLAPGLWWLQASLGVPFALALMICSLYAVALFVSGWGVQALSDRLPRLLPWRRPLAYGLGGATVLLPAVLAGHAMAAAPELLGSALLLLGLGIGLLGWRERQPLLAGPALVAWSAALVGEGMLGLLPVWEQLGGYLLLALAMLQGFAALWAGRRRGPALPYSVYAASLITGALAFVFTSGTPAELAIVAGGLALLWISAASVERSEPAAWGALALLSFALFSANRWLGLSNAWAGAWLVLELVGVCLAGWVAVRAGLAVWRRPGSVGALAVAVLATPLLSGVSPQLTLALASLGLLLVTLAVRERQLWYAYAAGAAFVGATLCQLADWGFREPQWYVMPAGLYLLALAAGLRRFQGRRRASQLVETVALLLLLGVTFGQAIRPEGGLAYSLLLFGEALLIAGYGALFRLRVPFMGGVAFFVAGVVWMSVDNVRLTNQWVLLGAVGLLMVAAYVILERHQERLLRAGRFWAAQLRSWG